MAELKSDNKEDSVFLQIGRNYEKNKQIAGQGREVFERTAVRKVRITWLKAYCIA